MKQAMCNKQLCKIFPLLLSSALLLSSCTSDPSSAQPQSPAPSSPPSQVVSTAPAPSDKSVHLLEDHMEVASADETFDLYFAWNGTAFYELVSGDGTHILLDPTYYETLRTCYDITDQVNSEVEDIKGCDWIFLTHTHIDHDNQIDEIMNTYRDAKAVIPGNSAAFFTTYYGITPSQNILLPAYARDKLDMGEFTVTVFEGKHTFLRGANANGPAYYQQEVLTDDLTPSQIVEALKNNSGNENLLCYYIEFKDGLSILFWNGDVVNDYKLLDYAGLEPDLMFYQQAACNVGGDKSNPDPTDLCNFIESVNPQVALPAHCEHFTMDNLYQIGDLMSQTTSANGGRTDYLEPTVLQWYGVNQLDDGTLEIKTVDSELVPEDKLDVLEMPPNAGLH